MLPSSPSQALSFAEPRQKDVSSFEKVLVSAGCDRSGEITEDKEVCDWTGIGSSGTKVRDTLEYVLVGIRTWKSFLLEMKNWRMVLHYVEMNGGMLSLYKDLELPHCSDVFYQPM
jgi:hypothetical protein